MVVWDRFFIISRSGLPYVTMPLAGELSKLLLLGSMLTEARVRPIREVLAMAEPSIILFLRFFKELKFKRIHFTSLCRWKTEPA